MTGGTPVLTGREHRRGYEIVSHLPGDALERLTEGLALRPGAGPSIFVRPP
jgi:hypothetical protein